MNAKKRILIIGSGGAGKSTFAKALSRKTGLPLIHLDSVYWRENWQPLSKEEFDEALEALLAKDEWIMDGNYNRTLPRRLECADYAVYLDFHPLVCVTGVLKRVIRYYGKTRPDMGPGCPEKFDFSFLKWVYTFRKTHRAKYLSILESCGKDYVILRKRKELGLFLKSF